LKDKEKEQERLRSRVEQRCWSFASGSGATKRNLRRIVANRAGGKHEDFAKARSDRSLSKMRAPWGGGAGNAPGKDRSKERTEFEFYLTFF